MKPIWFCSVLLCFLLAAYFYLAPLFAGDFFHVIRPRSFRSIDEARSYYTVASAFFGVLSAALGLLLGYFYYTDKRRNDREQALRTRQRAQIIALLGTLDETDDLVETLFARGVRSSGEIAALRLRISKHFDRMIDMLNTHSALLGLTDEQCTVLVRLYSLVEKSRVMQEPLEGLSGDQLQGEREEYLERMREARRLCLSCFAGPNELSD